MVEYANCGEVWYAMKTTYCREMRAKATLDSFGVEAYVPMKCLVRRVGGVKSIVREPAMHNLIFVKCDADRLYQIKRQIDYLHNYLTMSEGVLRPIIVSESDMEQFIRCTSAEMESVIYVDLASTTLSKGTRVRVIGGEFEGLEGVLMRVKGARDRRVVLSVEGVIAVAMTSIDASLIEVVKEKNKR